MLLAKTTLLVLSAMTTLLLSAENMLFSGMKESADGADVARRLSPAKICGFSDFVFDDLASEDWDVNLEEGLWDFDVSMIMYPEKYVFQTDFQLQFMKQ